MKLGRLFWKFFCLLWLAQIATAFGVGVLIWLLHQRPALSEEIITEPPPANMTERPPQPPPIKHPHKPRLRDLLYHPIYSYSDPPRSNESRRGGLFPFLPIATGGVVSLIFAWFLAWYFARPIATLRQAFASEANGRLDTRIGAAMGSRRDELTDLGRDFDRMAERLQNLVDSQQRLLHDVSHELRSPLARIEAASDLMQQQPERSGEFIGRLRRDADRINILVGELLTLARLDAEVAPVNQERFDLIELLHEVIDDACFLAEPKACLIDLNAPATLPVNGDYELLRRAIDNVLRNAVRHSPAGATIDVTAEANGKRNEVTIADRGEGVSENDLTAIFEPFYRSSNAKAFEGHGLGLTITRQILKRHLGDISASHRKGGGLILNLTWPRESG